jgi:hypothetical protein
MLEEFLTNSLWLVQPSVNGDLAEISLSFVYRRPVLVLGWRWTMKRMMLVVVVLVVVSTVANATDDGVDLYHPEKYGTPQQKKIPNPFKLEWGPPLGGIAQVQTYYVYPTMQDAPSWLTRKYKTKPRMHR